MAWVESASKSFRCRHASAEAADADRLLGRLERTRRGLEPLFHGLELVFHDHPASLVASNPLLPLGWALAAPGARPAT